MIKALKKLLKPKKKLKTKVLHPTFGNGKIYKRTAYNTLDGPVIFASIKFDTALLTINQAHFKGARIELVK